ncbi:MAG: beta strand repeat-containing protein [Paracoccaceae bacterium]
MKSSNILFATASVMALSVTSALADNNEAWLTQTNNGHSASIDQSAGSNNQAGRSGLQVVQLGEFTLLGNTLSITQSGNNNDIGLVGGGFRQFNQSGPGSTATVTQSTDDNVIGSVLQVARTASATGNSLVATQQGGNGNTINLIAQDRSGQLGAGASTRRGHSAVVTQNGAHNFIDVVRQGTQFDSSAGNVASIIINGDNNGGGSLTGLALVGAANSSSVQSGTANEIGFLVSGGSSNQFGFRQVGSANQAVGLELVGSNNELGVNQAGTTNVVSLATIGGDGNVIGFNQAGTSNQASATVSGTGNNNEFAILQNGTTNSADVSIVGSDNGATASNGLFGAALLTGVTAGLIEQFGNSNEAELDIIGGNNAFAFLQGIGMVDGDFNSITGTVTGNNNAAAVSQSGSSNTANFTQVGNGNSAGIKQ